MTDETQQTPEQSQEQAPTPQLTLQDLTLALQTIQIVAQRGAIRADEMETVGGLHNRLFAFLQAQGALVTQSQTSAEPTEEPQGE